MVRKPLTFVVFLSYILCQSNGEVSAEEFFEVLSVTDVPFPTSSGFAATLKASYKDEIAEFTVCHRILIQSYNSNWMYVYQMFDLEGALIFNIRYELDAGMSFAGFQGSLYFLWRNIPGGGRGGASLPAYFGPNLPKFIQTGSWYNHCFAYSSKLHVIHTFGNGLKISTHYLDDEVEDPLSSDFFQDVRIFQNNRGLFTDFNIYSTFFDEKAMEEWTSGCIEKPGEIFSWNIKNINITQNGDSPLNVSVTRKSKAEVCPDPNSKEKMQEPSKIAGQTEKKRYKPKISKNPSFVGKILELITDRYNKDAAECKDRCYRLNGEIMAHPQTEEEAMYMDKTLWNYMMKKASNDLDALVTGYKFQELWVGGESRLEDYNETIPDLAGNLKKRNGLYQILPSGDRGSTAAIKANSDA